jgi:hypothetical protein
MVNVNPLHTSVFSVVKEFLNTEDTESHSGEPYRPAASRVANLDGSLAAKIRS